MHSKSVAEYLSDIPSWRLSTDAELVADAVADGYLTVEQAARDAGVSVDAYRSSPVYREAVDLRVSADLPVVGDEAGS